MQNNESSNICTIIVDKYKYLNYNMGVNKRWQQNSSSAINVAEIKTISCPNLIIPLKNIFVNYSLQKFYERGLRVWRTNAYKSKKCFSGIH